MKTKVKTLELQKRMYLKGYTQTKLAKELGISKQSVYGYVNGKKAPRADLAYRICSLLECDIKDLFEFIGE